ncbi:hypothetical protein OG723_44260 (plasmid) [Streptomyces sp. NBC_01278]|uniref:hypothetical protein n=1 Tax=Streptomyces sp. NBC_01278 TaxID=2903809 RepID=UPI002E30CACE|nr:hypothetical protein [Streptomyces sp. NBC_01278]
MSLTATEAPPGRGLVPGSYALGMLMREMRNRTLDTSNFKPLPEDLGEPTLDEGYTEIRQQAWLNSLRLADHADYARWTLEQLDEVEQHRDRLRNWVTAAALSKRKNVRPKSLNGIAFGNVGSGKSTAIIAAGGYAAANGLLPRYLKHTHYLQWLRPNGAPKGYTEQQIRRVFAECDLLVLDELCGEMDNANDWVRKESGDLIDARVASGRPTLCATNLNDERIGEIMGSRFLSRLGGGASLFEMVGEDRRRPVQWGRKPEEQEPTWG